MNAEHAGKSGATWRHTGASAPPPLSPTDAVCLQTPATRTSDLCWSTKRKDGGWRKGRRRANAVSHLSDGALALVQVSFHLRELMFFLHQTLFQIADLEKDLHKPTRNLSSLYPSIHCSPHPPQIWTASIHKEAGPPLHRGRVGSGPPYSGRKSPLWLRPLTR